MSDDLLTSKIELLQEQIHSIEKRGFFTEKDMDSKAAPLRMELAILQQSLALSIFSKSIYKYGLTLIEYTEASEKFSAFMDKMNKLIKVPNDIVVVDAEILTQNHQEA